MMIVGFVGTIFFVILVCYKDKDMENLINTSSEQAELMKKLLE
jgi:hypothetical protein